MMIFAIAGRGGAEREAGIHTERILKREQPVDLLSCSYRGPTDILLLTTISAELRPRCCCINNDFSLEAGISDVRTPARLVLGGKCLGVAHVADRRGIPQPDDQIRRAVP